MQIHSLLMIAVGALVAGCATTAQPPAARTELANLTRLENLPGKPGCFWRSEFQGQWTVLNDSTLIVHAPLPKDVYLIKLFEPVVDLNFKERLGFEDKEHSGRICNNGDDYLIVAGWPRGVPIEAVRTLTMAEQDRLLRAAGKPVSQLSR